MEAEFSIPFRKTLQSFQPFHAHQEIHNLYYFRYMITSFYVLLIWFLILKSITLAPGKRNQ